MSAAQTALFDIGVTAPSSESLALSQWFTPAWLARKVVTSCGVRHRSGRILEPSAGDGALVNALRADFATARIDAVDIDSSLCARHGWEWANYLTRPSPAERYDLAVMNPPYEDGADCAFVAKAMDESDAVIAIVRAVFLNGADRYSRIWSRVESGEWSLVMVAHLVKRPSFLLGGVAMGGAQADFAVVKLSRRPSPDTHVEWWREGQ